MNARAAILYLLTSATSLAHAADPDNGLAVAQRWCNACHVILQKDTGWHNGNVAPRFTLLTLKTEADMRALLRRGTGKH